MPNKSRVYIGRLSRRTRARDLEKEFSRYGRIRDLEIKHDYAFIVGREAGVLRFEGRGRSYLPHGQ